MGRRATSAGMALIATLAIAMGGCSEEEASKNEPASPTAGWTTYRDAARGLQVQFPSDWRRARTSLTPYLSDPSEVLSLGTGPLRQAPRAGCAQMPTGALEALGPRDAFVSVQERRTGVGSYPARPRRFTLSRANRVRGLECVSHAQAGDVDAWWIAFRDRGRGFYALVAIGADAPAARRAAARRVLDSLRFSPRRSREGG